MTVIGHMVTCDKCGRSEFVEISEWQTYELPKAWRSFYVKNNTSNKEDAVELCPICAREFSNRLKESGVDLN